MQSPAITSILANDEVRASRQVLNDNFTALATALGLRTGKWLAVTNEAALTSLTTAQVLDVAELADHSAVYVLIGASPTNAANWLKLNDLTHAADIATAIATASGNSATQVATALAASQAYTDAQLGLRPIKDPARVAFTSNVNIASPGTLIDVGVSPNVTVTTTQRVLLFGQTDGTQNGPYIYNGSSVPMTRTPDADTSSEMKPGSIIAVTEGTYADLIFELKTDAPIVLGTTSLVFGLTTGGSSSSPIIAYNGSSYAPRNTVSNSSTTSVLWVGPLQPTVGGGYMVVGVDNWLYTTEAS